MKKINLAITGCMGRMGQQLIRSSKTNKKFRLVSLTENKKIIDDYSDRIFNRESFQASLTETERDM